MACLPFSLLSQVVTKARDSPAELSQAAGDTAPSTGDASTQARQPADVSTFAPATSMTSAAGQVHPPSPDAGADVQHPPPTQSEPATSPSDADVSSQRSPDPQLLAPTPTNHATIPSVAADAATFTPPAEGVGCRHLDPSVGTALSAAHADVIRPSFNAKFPPTHADGSTGPLLAGACSQPSVQHSPPACSTSTPRTQSFKTHDTSTPSPVDPAPPLNRGLSPPTSSSPVSTSLAIQRDDAHPDPPLQSTRPGSCVLCECPNRRSGEEPGAPTVQLLLRHGGLATRSLIRMRAEGSVADLWTAIEEVLVPGVSIEDFYAVGNGRILGVSDPTQVSSKGLGDGSQIELRVRNRGGGRGKKQKEVPVKVGPMDKYLRPKPVCGKRTSGNGLPHQVNLYSYVFP